MKTKLTYIRSHVVRGTLLAVSGLRIGAGRETIEIGGIDSPVVKHPHSGDPYIPGSSLKGKIRSQLEWLLDCIEPQGKVWGTTKDLLDTENDVVLRVFGTTHEKWCGGPGRAIFRDATLEHHWRQRVVGQGLPRTEEKVEVRIDRLTGKAADGSIHRMERVPAGARFELEILFKEYSVDGDEGAVDRKCLNWLLAGLRLLEQDALGGSGSRGYGRVKFLELMLNGQDIQAKFEGIKEVNKAEPPVRFLS